MNMTDLIQILGVLTGLTTLITGTSVFFLKQAASKVQQSNDDLSKEMKADIISIERKVTTNLDSLRNHIDGRIDNLRDRMDVKHKDIQEYVSTEVSHLKVKDNDLELKLDLTREKQNDMEKALLQFKLDANEKYQQKKFGGQ